MINVKTFDGAFNLRWINGAWRDEAGHVWILHPKDNHLSSDEHGFVPGNQWHIPKDEQP